MVSTRVPMAWLCGMLSVTSLGGCDDPQSRGAPGAAAQPTSVLVPDGSAIERLSFLAEKNTVLTVDETQIPRAAGRRPFPLIAYRQFCEGVPMSEFGLTEPRLRLVGRTAADEQFTVDFGQASFTGGGIYARKEGSDCVYLVPSSAVALIAAPAGDQAAAPFRPPAQPEITGEATADGGQKEPTHPWVLQVKKHPAEPAGRGAAADQKGD